MSRPGPLDALLRDLAPRALAAVVRRFGHFADAEDAVQEALVAAAATWPGAGRPDDPLAWVVRVAGRRMTDLYRSDEARRRREDLAASWSRLPHEPVSERDDTLVLFFMCCHPSLSPPSAVALTLRALGGLSTRQIAAAFLVPEATMAQRISRAKRTVTDSGERFAVPGAGAYGTRMAQVLRVAYLVFNEGYAASDGPELQRVDLAGEGIRLARLLHVLAPDDAEVTALLALMLLTDARRPAHVDPSGALVPLSEQDRTCWDRTLVLEGTRLATAALRVGPAGPYALQAAIAALHAEAPRHEETDWDRILVLYDRLEQVAPSPVVSLNRAVALAMVEGPDAGLAVLDELATRSPVPSHRWHAVRGHLLERRGDTTGARAEYREAAGRTANQRERDYLVIKAAGLGPTP